MALANIGSDSFLHVGGRLGRYLARKQRTPHVLPGVPAGSTNHDLIVLLIPFDHRARTNPQPLANLSGNGDLTLSREFRMCNDHAWNITLVMKWSQAAKTELLTAISQRKQRHIRQTARTTCPPPAPPAARNRSARKSAAQHRPRATPRAARPRAVHVRSVPPGTRSADDCPRGNIDDAHPPDRKSTRLNSSHVEISYAVFCLKKKKKRATRKSKVAKRTHRKCSVPSI